MPWDEAIRLGGILRADPSSMLAASMEGWDHSISREALAILDLFDLMHMANSKKRPKPHPGRPTKPTRERQQMGNVAGRSPEHVLAILAAARSGTALPA